MELGVWRVASKYPDVSKELRSNLKCSAYSEVLCDYFFYAYLIELKTV